jgi:t-SNARE complex subunit (syntaxin)
MSYEEEDTCMSDETLSAHRLQIPAYIIMLVVVVVAVVVIVIIIVVLEGDRDDTWYGERQG